MYLQLTYTSSNVKVDNLTFISFQENYQTAKIYFYLCHVIPLNKTISILLVSTRFFQFCSLMQLLLLKAWFSYDCYNRCDRWEKKSSAIAAIIWKPLSSDRSDNDHWDRTFYISEIVATAIAEIFFSVMLSYASLTKYVLITIILSKQEGCIMLFTFSCFNCQNEKGLLNFVSERIKLVYRINNTRYNVRKK